MPGAPSVYYGSEWGIEGQRTWNSDDVLRPCLDLNNIPNADNELCDYISIKDGSFENTVIKNEQLVFCRRAEGQTAYVAFNLCDHDEKIGFNVDGGYSTLTDVLNDNESFAASGYVEINIPANSARILVLNNGDFRLEYNGESANQSVEQAQEQEQEPTPTPQKPVVGETARRADGSECKIVAITTDCETGEEIVVYRQQPTGDLKAVLSTEF